MSRHLGVHPRASCYVVLMRLGPTANLELFEYAAPDQRRDLPAPGDAGGHRLVFEVDDADRAYRHLLARGDLPVVGEPQPVGVGPHAGDRTVEFRSPWGMELGVYEPATPPGSAVRPHTHPAATAAPAAALPGLRGVRHVGYTVPDLDLALGFFTASLGGALVYRAPQRFPTTGPDNVDTALVRLGPVTNVELRAAGDSSARLPRNSDVGGHHLAFYVADLDAAAAFLRTVPGVEVMGEPQLIAEGGPIDGARWVYFRSPWGLQLEALSLPAHLPYERSVSARRFGPADRWSNG
jgi:catechol 2,3-dioxygenase-like lactoylglutathione lyase family enzyme